MINHKYKMLWTHTYLDDDIFTYESKSLSLEGLIIDTINNMENGNAKFIFVDRKENDESGDTFAIHFVVDEQTYEYDCKATTQGVSEFLETYVNEWGYEDKVEIQTITQ